MIYFMVVSRKGRGCRESGVTMSAQKGGEGGRGGSEKANLLLKYWG